MSKRLTREQYIAQFPVKVRIPEDQIKMMEDIKNELHYPVDFEGVRTYQLLDRLIIRLDGNYFISDRK